MSSQRAIDAEALEDYLAFSVVPGEWSILRDIRNLLLGHVLSVAQDGLAGGKAVVGTAALVTKPLPGFAMIRGNPARVKRMSNQIVPARDGQSSDETAYECLSELAQNADLVRT